jgi:hypothetical protein
MDTPLMNIRYEGTSGSTQGAKKDNMPALKAIIPFSSTEERPREYS